MPKFSQTSFSKLTTCHPDLQVLFYEVIKYFDCTILEGYRDKINQEKAFASGNTQLHWPHGKHNSQPSMAVDATKYPIDFNDRVGNCYFAGYVMGISEMLFQQGKITHKIRWGGDFNQNNEVKDGKFIDIAHFELIV